MKRALTAIATAMVLAACAPEPIAVPSPPPAATAPALLELPDLEVRADGRDRFASCQNLPASYSAPRGPVPDAGPDGGPVANAEHTIADLRRPFHDCYQAGLHKGSPPVALVHVSIDITPEGAVSNVRTGFTCGLDERTLSCLEGNVASARFDAPGGRGSKLVVPINFTTSKEVAHRSAVTLDMSALHACYATALARTPHAKANATFRVHDEDVKVDDWEGDGDLLACAAGVLQRAGAAFSMKIRFEE